MVPDRRAPVVTHMVWYKVGAADETPGKSGLAHFLEHLMFKGTSKHPIGQFSQTVAFVGGQENAFTTQDYTGYFQRVSRENLKTLMEFESDRMTGLVLTDEAVGPELKVVLEEYNQRVANNPRARLVRADRRRALSQPSLRQAGDRLAARDREAQSRGRASRSTGASTRPTTRCWWSPATSPPTRSRRSPRRPTARCPRSPRSPRAIGRRSRRRWRSATSRSPMPQVQQPSLSRSYLVPSSTTAKPGESEALEVLAFILGHGSTSRLYRTLVVDRELAVSAGGYYSGTALDATQFGVYGSPKPGVTLQKLEDAIDAVLDDVIAKGVTADEVERAKNRLIADAIYAQDSQATMARWYGAALTTGSTVESVQTWPDRIRAVTADAVNAAAKTWLDKRRSVTGYLVKDAQREEKKT